MNNIKSERSSIFREFVNINPISKTLRFEAEPIGKTEENILAGGLIDEDEQRSWDYKIVKELIDRYHKKFISETLNGVDIDWDGLCSAIEEYRRNKENVDKLKKLQKKYRKDICDIYKKHRDYNNLFKEKLITSLLPEAIANGFECSEKEKSALQSFDKFTTYFIGFWENRKNIYTDEEKSTAVAYRLVNQNFPRYIDNLAKYNQLMKISPEVISNTEKELADILQGRALAEIFTIEYYNQCLTQQGIDFYNSVLGGYTDGVTDKKYRGLNEFANLYSQNNKGSFTRGKIKLLPLYKQILSDREKISFLPEKFNDENELLTAVNSFVDFIEENHFFDNITVLVKSLEEQNFNPKTVYISAKDLNFVSQKMFGSWSKIRNALKEYKENEISDKPQSKRLKEIKQYMDSPIFSLDDIADGLEFISHGSWHMGLEEYLHLVNGALDKISNIDYVMQEIIAEFKDPKQDEKTAAKIKELLDNYQEIVHLLKPFIVPQDIQKDDDFYSVLEPAFELISEIIPLYNKVRNYITQKPYETEKFKLNFKVASLFAGWDKNKEQDNACLLFMKDGMYYIGIMDKNNKLKPLELEGDSGNRGYQKMVYKLLPGPNKMFPKVFFSAKGIEEFQPSEYILKGYAEDKHKKGENFDIKYCHDLIDFFKDSIKKHKDWRFFDFEFSPTESYEDISQFYREVTKANYKLSFVNISETKVNQWIDEGRLYLFRLKNKDFASGATGRPNLHTLYWKALFDEDNLKDIVFKLNGEAEFFYRRKSIDNPYIHKKGSFKVNKRDNLGNPIPEDIWQEIFRYANKKIDKTELSGDACRLIDEDLVRITEVKHELVKDKRYSQNKYLFHVPLTINYKADGKNNINADVNLLLKDSPDINIIGIDRGERNLIYLTLINQKGEILKQKSFNVINRMDYQAKLDQIEKERQSARQSWTAIGNIKEMKEGYISQVVYEIVRMMVENNAIVVMEDLNFGFKRGRFKVEKQVYQKFEKALIEKLNYLVFKDYDKEEPGGVLKGLQLTNKFESFNKMGKQNGFLFYIPAGYTSKIDPVTGFVDLFNFRKITNEEARRTFIDSFDSIYYDAVKNLFAFTFDYDNFSTYQTSSRKKWTTYTIGKRIAVQKKNNVWKHEDVYLTDKIKDLLEKHGILYLDGQDLKESILQCEDSSLIKDLIYYFRLTIQMRNSNSITDEDFIISPVMDETGIFFDSREMQKIYNEGNNPGLPIDADANGAYHIALKGKLVLDLISNNVADDGRISYKDMKIENPVWFDYAQNKKKYLK